MKQFVIRHEEQEGRYWSLYGWAPVSHALRFSGEDDAAGFRDSHGLYGAKVQGMSIEDEVRPDLITDYNPFAPSEA